MFSWMKEFYQESNKVFLWVKIILSAAGLYFAVRVIYLLVAGLLGSTSLLEEFPNVLFFWLIFVTGLLHITNLVEIAVVDKKRNFHLILLKTIFVLVLSFGFLIVGSE